MKFTRLGGALALALMLCAPAMASDPNLGKKIIVAGNSGTTVAAGAIYCPDANGNAVACTFGGGVTPALPTAWTGTAFDARSYGSATITVNSTPTTAYAIQWSADNATWTPVTCIDLSFNTSSTIAATFTGALSCQGGGYIRLNGGAGGSFLIGAAQ